MAEDLISAVNLKQDEFDQAEALVVSLLQESYPTLDLRRGTAIRDLIVRPMSAFYALDTKRNDELARTRSLQSIVDSPSDDDTEVVNQLLENFDTMLREGGKTTGLLKISVAAAATYSLGVGREFESADGSLFVATTAVKARVSDGTLTGPDESGYYFFEVPVEASGGISVQSGQAFEPTSTFSGYISAAAYSDFVIGMDQETPAEALKRLPTAVSSRGLYTKAGIASVLTDPTGDGYLSSIRAVSVRAFGDTAQYRDRRNIHGAPTGGCIDIYARTFSEPSIVTLFKKASLQSDGRHLITVEPEEAPGFYAVKSVTLEGTITDVGFEDNGITAIGSLDFNSSVIDDYATAASHRLTDEDSLTGTVYRGVEIAVSANDAINTDQTFKVELYAHPDISVIQDYVSRDDIRNAAVDTIVRSPFICIIFLQVVIRVSADDSVNIPALKEALSTFINDKSFSGTLDASEIASVAHNYAILSMDTSLGRKGGLDMRGYVIDGAGQEHELAGHRIDISDINDTSGLLVDKTCVFATSPERISVEVVSI